MNIIKNILDKKKYLTYFKDIKTGKWIKNNTFTKKNNAIKDIKQIKTAYNVPVKIIEK